MNILLSGHTSGIGKSIFNLFTNKGDIVIGYSRTNNKDLYIEENRINFINDAKCSDIIILNANLQYTNVELLYKIFDVVKGTNKITIVIGSRVTEASRYSVFPYQIEKLAIEEAAKQLQNVPNGPYISIIRPGYVDTPSVSNISDKKINPDSIAMLIYDVIQAKLIKDYKILNILIAPN